MDRKDMRSFHATVKGARHRTAPVSVMCDDRQRNVVIDKTIMVSTKWKEYFKDLFMITMKLYRATATANRDQILACESEKRNLTFGLVAGCPAVDTFRRQRIPLRRVASGRTASSGF